jgi:hypothetical protein
VAALKQIGVAPSGVPCYVDEGTHIGLNQKPFWYAGALNVYHMGANYTRMELHNPAAVEPAKEKVSEIAARLAKQDGGGLISIFYHPCEWVHREFWDGVNFSRGRNPPREEWKAPPQRSPEETEGAFRRFGEYIDHIRSIPGVRFVTASDLAGIYSDSVRTEGATERELDELARRILNRATNVLNFQFVEKKAFSVADQFEFFTFAVSELAAGKKLRLPLIARGLFGPDNPPAISKDELQVAWPPFRDAVLDAREFIQTHQRVPARVFIGTEAVSPADFLVGLASAYEHERKNGKLPEQVILGKGVILLSAHQVAEDTPGLFGGWVIHKADFRAPRILEVARLQAWTLKPAIRRE